jgi:hypothetical protein
MYKNNMVVERTFSVAFGLMEIPSDPLEIGVRLMKCGVETTDELLS